MLVHIEYTRKMVEYMKNKKQQIVYIDGRWCDTVNEYYLKDGWQVVSIHPIASKEQIAAYILLEKEDGVEEVLNQIGVTTRNSDGTMKSTNEVLEEVAEVWRSGLFL